MDDTSLMAYLRVTSKIGILALELGVWGHDFIHSVAGRRQEAVCRAS